MASASSEHPAAARDPRPSEARPAVAEGRGRTSRRRFLPRPETILLIISFAWTVGAKAAIIAGHESGEAVSDIVEATLCDVAFFAGVAMVFSLAYLVGLPVLIARATLLASAVLLGWSMANAAWLFATSVQLQPGVLGVLLKDPSEFWPVVQAHLLERPIYSVPIVATIVIAVAWFAWRMIGPIPVTHGRRRHLVQALLAGAVLGGASAWHWVEHRGGHVAYSGQVLGFSSHWYALVRVASDVTQGEDVDVGPERVLPRAGERAIAWPDDPPVATPNVVVIFLESVSHDATTLGGRDTTPILARLAAEGVDFVETRAPVAQTNKAFWSVLTGSTPDLEPDYAESVLADESYESFPTVLAPRGYRSAFFEMSKGSFECAPGFFSNLGFDWAWFRENLEDESAHVGYMSGDDFRLIEPMFEWLDGGSQPFFLSLITTVAHDPYELPAWWWEVHEEPEDRFELYLEAVRFTDAFVGAVVEELEQRGILDDTILCVIGDHGEGFRPESKRGRWAPFEEVIRVPWVVRWPAGVEAGRRIEWPCSQLDVMPTILTLLGADVTAAGFDGLDARAPIDADRKLFFSTWYEDSPVGYVQGARKLVHWPYTDVLFEYDLAADPGETARRTIEGAEKDGIVGDIEAWQRSARLVIPARRFREDVKYDHWRTFSSGRSAWSYYVP